jgi:hypothetical protein
MTRMDKPTHFSRRAMLKAGGALVVSIGAPVALDTVLGIRSAFAQSTKPPLVPDQLSSYIAINADGTVAAFFGKMDMGQGLYVSIAQMVAEELDVPFKAVTVFMADTRTSVNQGGASGSTGIQRGGVQMRAAAAEARRVLVEMAAQKLGLPAEQFTVTDGVVHARADATKKATYAELIGGRYFNIQLEWNKQIGNNLYAPGKAKPKDPKDYKIVGQPIKRADIAPKVFTQEPFVTDIKVAGMLHARMIRPPVAGATLVSIDEGSIKDIPGARVARENNFLAVVADNEWDAVKAHGKLKIQWSDAKPPFPSQAELYEHIRKASVRKREDVKPVGNVPVARLHGSGLRRGRDQGRARHLLERLAEAAFRARRHRPHARAADEQGGLHLGGRPRLLRPQRRRRLRARRGRARQADRQAGAAAIHARARHGMGPQGSSLDPQGAGRARRLEQGRGLRVPQQGLLAHRRADQRQSAEGYAGRTLPRRPPDCER